MHRLLRALALLSAFFLGLLYLTASPALAADSQVVVDTGINQVQVLSVLIGVILPIVVGLVTKRVTSESVKAVLLAFLAAVSGFVTEAINVGGFNDSFNWTAALLTWVMTFVAAVAAHFGLWKPTGVSAAAQRSLVK